MLKLRERKPNLKMTVPPQNLAMPALTEIKNLPLARGVLKPRATAGQAQRAADREAPDPRIPGPGWQRTGRWLGLIGCALFLACAWTLHAGADAPASVEPNFAAQGAGIEQRIAAAQTELEAARAKLDASAGETKSRIDDLRTEVKARQAFLDLYQTQRDELNKLQDLTNRVEAAARELKDWQPPAGDPPWPLAAGDAAQLALYQAQATATRLAAVIERSQLRQFEARKDRDKAESRFRAAEEQALGRSKANAAAADDKDLSLARLELDYFTEVAYWMDLEYQSRVQERRLNEIEIERLKQTLRHYDGRFSLSPEALADKNRAIDAKLERLRTLQAQAMEEAAAGRREVEAARASQAEPKQPVKPAAGPSAAPSTETSAPPTTEPPAEPAPHPAQPADTDRAVAIARANQERLQSRLALYRKALIPLQELLKSLWEQRAALYGKTRPDHAEMLKIEGEIEKIQHQIDLYRSDSEQAIASNSQLAAELREQLAAGPAEAEAAVLRARLAAANGKAEDAREAIDELEHVSLTMRMVTGEIDRIYRSGSMLQWLRNAWVTARIWVKAVWNFELMWVDETVKIEGREVKTTRSVTVGKSIGAVAILIGGYLFTAWTIRRVLALGVAWLGLSASRAALLGGWLKLGALATLILISFSLVDIPLQIFAFLGGALVLGIGFGAQTLLKNLISGVMLLTERPVRVGDLVEVDNIRGHITSIGIRVSTIYTSQGMAMHIPNSTLVEQRLINWTYSDPEVRYELRLGVAYGSDVDRVKTILLEAARAHPEVLDQPAPSVLLADFGDSALMFTLRFWMRIPTGGNERNATVSSDLRFGILAALNQAGIEIPYPQRDLRVIQDRPIAVRMAP